MDGAIDMIGLRPDGLRTIGYWVAKTGDGLPDPRNFIDSEWDTRLRTLASLYLSSGKTFQSWRGWSTCRICTMSNGSTCLSDGSFVWPEGLSHYVKVHDVRMPDEFMSHIINRVKNGEFDLKTVAKNAAFARSLRRR